jgi:transposase-like protein
VEVPLPGGGQGGQHIDFLFRAERDKVAARCFFVESIAQNGIPETITIDKSGSNLAALHAESAKSYYMGFRRGNLPQGRLAALSCRTER